MRTILVTGCLVLLAACAEPTMGAQPSAVSDRVSGATTQPATQMSDRDRVIAGIEAAGCVVIADNADAVFASVGLSEPEYRRIGAELVADGLADVSQIGVYRLQTPACAI